MYLTNNYAEGSGCVTGMLGRLSNGEVLQCVSGRWKKSSGNNLTITTVSKTGACNDYTYAACPSGTKIISGGHDFVSSCGCAESYRMIVHSRISGNSWVAMGACMKVTAYAYCVAL